MDEPGEQLVSMTLLSRPVRLTESARMRISEMMSGLGDAAALRVEVVPGGCSGFSYRMFFDSDVDESAGDILYKEGPVRVVVDRETARRVAGTVVDYLESEDLLGQGRFRIENPQALRTCGCGRSFS